MCLITESQCKQYIGPLVHGLHLFYEPPITLQLPMASDDSPDDDGTVESVGSKSIGSSPSSSHSDMSSPMFKPESLLVSVFSFIYIYIYTNCLFCLIIYNLISPFNF